jgi:hypothetical protein
MIRTVLAAFLAVFGLGAPALAQEAPDWVSADGAITLRYEALGWAQVSVSPQADLGLMPHAFLTMIAPGGAHDWEAIAPQAHCVLTAPLLGYWPDAPLAPAGQAEANTYFRGEGSLENAPVDVRWVMRGGVLIAALEYDEGQAIALVHSFMLATEDGPLLYVMNCSAPRGDVAALEQARAIMAGMRFALPASGSK